MTAVRRGWLVIVGLAAVCSGCSRPWNPQITELTSPAAAENSSESQLTTDGTHTILSWIERDGETTSLKFSQRESGGWSRPVTVATGDDWFINWADVPSVVRVSDRLLAAHWLQNTGPDSEGYEVRVVFSHDGGGTWSAPTTPHHDGTPTEHGFASLYPDGDGGVGVVWLDGRTRKGMALRSATFSQDGTQKSELVVVDRACECCPTAVARTSDGVIAAFRNLGDNDVRDIFVARSIGRGATSWSAAAPVHNDDWRIDACPVNGPAVAASGQTVVVAWFNAKTDPGHVFVAFSRDGGKTFAAPTRVDDASALGRVAVALLDDDSAVVGWMEFADHRSQFRMRRVSADREMSASTVVSTRTAAGASGYPRLVRAGRELMFAWTESQSGQARVRTAAWSMP